MNRPPKNVLLIEDNRDDIFLMQRAVKRSGVPWNLVVVTDGQQALDFFFPSESFTNRHHAPFPTLIFLDLKLPYVLGFDILSSIMDDPLTRNIPVVVLTSSPEQRDQKRAIELGAKGYMIKPPSENFLRKIAEGDWTDISQVGAQTDMFPAL